MRSGQGFNVRFRKAVMSAGRRHVWRDNAGVYPAADRGDIDAEPVGDLTSSDMHRFCVHARSLPCRASSVKHHNKYLWCVWCFASNPWPARGYPLPAERGSDVGNVLAGQC